MGRKEGAGFKVCLDIRNEVRVMQQFSGYIAELFEAALDGRMDELSDREKRLLINAAKLILNKVGGTDGSSGG